MQPDITTGSSYYDMQRTFLSGVTLRDIAEPLISFDETTAAAVARAAMQSQRTAVAGVRVDGHVAGYVLLDDLGEGQCGDGMLPFEEHLVLPDSTSLVDVVLTLVESPFAFVRVLGEVGGLVSREDLQDPPVRMWLFGIVTIMEMYYLRMIERHMGGGEWRQYLSDGRIAKAEHLLEERRRRGQDPRLLDCLQFGDKAQIVVRDQTLRELAGFQSRNRAEYATKMVERLRNNLAHTQDIVAFDWQTIVILAENIDRLLHWDESARG
jgi:hypothetical protein